MIAIRDWHFIWRPWWMTTSNKSQKDLATVIKNDIFANDCYIFNHAFFVYPYTASLEKSDSMEVFDITVYSKDELEEVCNLRQPQLFRLQDNFLCNVDLFDITKKYCSKTGSVHAKTSTNDNAELNISDTNTISGYYLKNNPDILSNHVDVEKSMAFIKPYMNVKSYTDCLIGGNDIITPLQQYLANRTYYSVCSGSLAIRLAPPKYTEKLSRNTIIQH